MADLVADAILWGTKAPANGGAQIAFMNVGGVRASLRLAPKYAEGPGQITYAEAYDVAPFGNLLVTMDLTGAQIKDGAGAAVRRRSPGWSRRPGARRLGGLHLHLGRPRSPQGDKVVAGSMTLNGVADRASRHDLPRRHAQLPRQRW